MNKIFFSTIIGVTLIFLLSPVYAETIDLNIGTVELPNGYRQERTGTKDSERGQIISANGMLTINYDIGFSAGVHMHPKLKEECLWYREQTINGRKVSSGIMNQDEKKQLIITITEEKQKGAFQFPANFWADFDRDEEIGEIMLIALSYSPHPGK